MQTQIITSQYINIFLTLPAHLWERFGVSLDWSSAYEHVGEDAFFIEQVKSLEDIDIAIQQFNKRHSATFSAREFNYIESKYFHF